MSLGATFDYEQALNLGLDYKKVLKDIIRLKLSPIRIGVKWNKVETRKDKYDWKIYDHILNEFNSHNIDVILVVGMKSPRWPEFFVPDWIDLGGKTSVIKSGNSFLTEKLYNFISSILERYKKLSSIKYIQVENEPFINVGENKLRISSEFLKKETEFVKDRTNLKVILNSQGLPTTGLLAEYIKGRKKYKEQLIRLSDVFGVNVFPKFEGKTLLNTNITFSASKLAWGYLKAINKKVRECKKECIVTELQAEPWQFGNVSFTDAFKNKTCNPDMVKEYLLQLEEIGFDTVLIWGTEFHLACWEKGNDEWMKIY